MEIIKISQRAVEAFESFQTFHQKDVMKIGGREQTRKILQFLNILNSLLTFTMSFVPF